MPRARSPKGKAESQGGSVNQQRLEFASLFGEKNADILVESLAELEFPTRKTAYTVAEITALLEETIDAHPVLGHSVIVQGEISNVKRSSRGHVYFTLKDATASINGILWASTAARLNFDLHDGLEVYLTGRLEIYRPSGSYSLVASKLEPVGIGALQLAFEQIKARLEAEGLFMDEFKKPIPDFPERIGIVTSSTGAVIHDMLRVIRRKNPLVHVLLHPVKVQGEGAAHEIAQAIRELNHAHYRLDILLVGRGGGSFEDLFCFSEEVVVRAIFASTVPIITGIGHEPDYALADAAADHSASTPTAAADWAVPDLESLLEDHATRARLLLESMAEIMLYHEQTLDHNATRLVELHTSGLESFRHTLAQHRERMVSSFDLYFQKQEQRLAQAAASVDAFNPLGTLARGYGVATNADQTVVRSIQQVKNGEKIDLRLSDGVLACQIMDIQKHVSQKE
jgi:exodeoxyribonuclease VII large subunit